MSSTVASTTRNRGEEAQCRAAAVAAFVIAPASTSACLCSSSRFLARPDEIDAKQHLCRQRDCGFVAEPLGQH